MITPNPNANSERNEIYYAWRRYWGYGLPGTKQAEEDFNTHFAGFQEGWKACEQFKKGEVNE